MFVRFLSAVMFGVICLSVVGCDQAVKNYVSVASPNPRTPATIEPAPPIPPGESLRFSAGGVTSFGANLRLEAGINGRARQFKMGADRGAKLSIGMTRIAPTH